MSPTAIYLDCEVLACVSITKPDGTVGAHLIVADKDVPALKASGLAAWVDDAKSELPEAWSKLDKESGKLVPLHEYLGLSPRPVASVDAQVKPEPTPIVPLDEEVVP